MRQVAHYEHATRTVLGRHGFRQPVTKVMVIRARSYADAEHKALVHQTQGWLLVELGDD